MCTSYFRFELLSFASAVWASTRYFPHLDEFNKHRWAVAISHQVEIPNSFGLRASIDERSAFDRFRCRTGRAAFLGREIRI